MNLQNKIQILFFRYKFQRVSLEVSRRYENNLCMTSLFSTFFYSHCRERNAKKSESLKNAADKPIAEREEMTVAIVVLFLFFYTHVFTHNCETSLLLDRERRIKNEFFFSMVHTFLRSKDSNQKDEYAQNNQKFQTTPK